MGVGPTSTASDDDGTGVIVGKVTVRGLKDYTKVVVYVDGVKDPAGTKRKKRSIVQKKEQFRPSLVVVPVDTTIAFPNKDRGVVHNVFSPGTGPFGFDLDRYEAGPGKKLVFDTVGEIDIFCDIHPNMAAKVKVVPSSLFVRVSSDGTYRLEGVPPGKRKVVAWVPDSKEVSTTVEVVSGDEVSAANLNLTKGKAKSHLNKTGTSYPDYP